MLNPAHPAAPAMPPPSSSEGKHGSAIAGGMLAGVAGRLGTNNLTQTAATFQNGGGFKPDLSALTARGQVCGAGLQVGAVYGIKSAAGPALERALGPQLGAVATGALAGAGGGLVMHPFSVRFFLQNDLGKKPPRVPGMPALSGLLELARNDPKAFCRGLPARTVFSGLDWGLYFGAKAMLRDVMPEGQRKQADTLAATAAIVATTPIYQVYVRQIQTGDTANECVRKLWLEPAFGSKLGSAAKQAASRQRSVLATAAFTGIAVLEKLVVDGTAELLEKRRAD